VAHIKVVRVHEISTFNSASEGEGDPVREPGSGRRVIKFFDILGKINRS